MGVRQVLVLAVAGQHLKMVRANLKKTTKKSNKRIYDNSSRQEKADKTQKHIIQTYVKLLADRRGADVSIEELALASKISQRTVFRLFKDKEALYSATDLYIEQFVQLSIQKIQQTDILSFTRDVFNLFEEHEDLMMAYMFSSFGAKTREIFRKKLNKFLIDQIVDAQKIKLTRAIETRLAVIVTLINVKIWHDIRTDFKHSSKEIGQAVSWAIETLIRSI